MTQFSNALIDVGPWPNGLGFANATLWWEYVWACDERARLDHLLTAALLSTDIRRRLLDHDVLLLETFHLSEGTITCICAIRSRGLNSFTAELLTKPAISIMSTSIHDYLTEVPQRPDRL